MTDKLRAAAKAALETLDCGGRNYSRAAHILRAALAEPEQEPVGKFSKFSDGVWKEVTASSPGIFLYIAPPRREWVGLTDDEVNLIYAEPQTHVGQYAKAIEAKLREKNN